MRKFAVAALAMTLALALSLDSPRPAAAQTVTQKVASCNAKMEAEYEKTKPHLIFLVAAKKACRNTDGDSAAASRWVSKFQPSVDAKLKKMRDDFDSNFSGKIIKEPGLVGMAEKLLREMFRAEAKTLLPALAVEKERIRLANEPARLAAEKKRIAAEKEKKRIAAEKERIRLANEPARLAAEKIRLEKEKIRLEEERLKLEECEKSNAALPPGSPKVNCGNVLVITVTKMITMDTTSTFAPPPAEPLIVIQYGNFDIHGGGGGGGGGKTPLSPPPTNPTEFYEFKLLDMISKNSDMALGLKLLLYDTLVRIVNAGAKTPGEKEFHQNMREYVRQANISVAEKADELYEEWKQGEERRKNRMGKARNHPYILALDIAVPADFEKAAMNAIMGNALAIVTASILDKFRRSEAFTATGWALLGGTVATGAGALSVSIGGSVAMLNSGAMLAGMVTGPVVLIAAMVTMTAVAAVNMKKRDDAMEKIATTMARAKKPVDLRTYFNTPEKTVFLQYLFAKATSEYSPTGLKDAGTGCRACFYEDNNYNGKRFCTSGRVNDLKKQTIAGTGKGYDFDFGDKISSVWLDNAKCPVAYVNLYEHKNGQGKKLTLLRSSTELRPLSRGKKGNWNDKASSVTFYDKNAPRCEVCIHKDRNYSGGYYCASGPVQDLRPVGWSDKASSVTFDKSSCPQAKLWLYEDENFKGKSVELSRNNPDFKYLDNSKSWGRKEWNDDVTSLFFSPSGVNPYAGRQLGGCRVCLYESTHYNGGWVCVSGGSGNAKLKDKEFDLNDKATSIDFQTKDCPKGKSMVATLYQHSEGKGSQLQMYESDPNFGRLKRGRKNWNDTVSSMYVKMVDTKTLNCQVCIYEAAGYKGAKYCTNGSVSHLKDVGFNDKTSSIRIFNNSCKDAGVTVYENAVGRGRRARYTASTANVGRSWNDKITGIAFSPTMKATMRAEKARSDKQCRVCFYEHAGFKGKAFCTDGAYSNLKNLRAGGRKEWNDDISSIRVDVPACRGGTVTIYEHANYGGKRVTLSSDNGDLRRLNAGDRKEWNDDISSLKFNKPAKIKKWETVTGKALDISIGPNGSIWVIGSNNVPYKWTGTGWKKVPGVSATRIDVGPNGWAWVVGTDGYGYHWRDNKWNKVAGVKISDVSISANSKAWAIGTDKQGKNHSIYRFTGQWTKVPGGAVRIDVSPLGYPWVVSANGRVYIWSEKLKKFLLIQPPRPANDIAVSVNGKAMVSIKAGGSATWNGGGWTQDRSTKKLTNIAVDKNNDPWVTTARQEIWAFK